MSIPQGHDAVTLDDPMARLRAVIADVERMTTVVVCRPDDEARIQAAIDRTEFSGLFRVQPMAAITPGTMLVLDRAKLWPEKA